MEQIQDAVPLCCFFFLERVPAALQHLTKPALSFLLSPPQNASVKARPALEQVYLLLGHSEDIFFLCRNRGHLSWQGLHRRPGTPPLQNDTSLKSPTHSGSGAVSPVEGFQLHLHACIYRRPAPGCFWRWGCKKNKARFVRRGDFRPRGGNWVVVLHFFLPSWHLLRPHTSVLGFGRQLSNDDSAVRRTPPHWHHPTSSFSHPSVCVENISP